MCWWQQVILVHCLEYWYKFLWILFHTPYNQEQNNSTSKEKPDFFAKYFAANFTLNWPAQFSLSSITAVPFNMPEIASESNTFAKLYFSLKSIYFRGQMAYQQLFFKKPNFKFAPVLTRLFQSFYDKGIFPDS